MSSHGSDDGGEHRSEQTLTLEKAWVLRGAKSQRLWLPEIREVQGCMFIKLSKFDRALTWWALGASLDMRAGKGRSCNVQGFDTWLDLRKAASSAAVHEALQHDDVPNEKEQKRKGRIVREGDKDLLSQPWVITTLPAVSHDGKECGPLAVKCLYGISTPDLWVEFSHDTMMWFRAMVRSDRDAEKWGRTRERKKVKSSPKKPSSPKKDKTAASPKKAATKTKKGVSPKRRVLKSMSPSKK